MDIRICQNCGNKFMPRSFDQRFCSIACQHASNKSSYLQYYQHLLDERIDRKIQVGQAKHHTHVDPNLSLNEIAKRAKEAHMTYGEYVTKYNI